MFARLATVLAAVCVVLGGCSQLGAPGASVAEGGIETSAVADEAVARVKPAAYRLPPPGLAQDAKYLLDTGDRLRVFVYGEPNLSRLYIVDHEGKITVPLIGTVKARGLTTYQLEAAVRSRLAGGLVRDPKVTVDVQQNRPFFILGEVRSAGQYPYVSGMTVETAVAIAGGYSERANERVARVTRRMGDFADVIEAPPGYVLQPGDTVYVYERYF